MRNNPRGILSKRLSKWSCKWHRLIYKLAPLNIWKAAIIQSHFDSCPACRASHELSPELFRIGVQPGEVNVPGDLWDRIGRQIANDQSTVFRPPRPVRRWTAVTAAMIVLIIPLALWWHNSGSHASDTKNSFAVANRDIVIHSISKEHRPAQAVVFQSDREDRVIIWVK